MTGTLLAVREEADGSLRLTLLLDGEKKKKKTVSLPREDYIEAGAPQAGDAIHKDDLLILLRQSARTEALDRALMILGASDNSAAALCKKLVLRGFSRDAAVYAVESLISRGYLSDREQLLRYVPELATRKKYAKRRLIAELVKKGYRRADIEEAITDAVARGEVDFDGLREQLLSCLPLEATAEERRALLYRHGF